MEGALHVEVLTEDDFQKRVSCTADSSILLVFGNFTNGKINSSLVSLARNCVFVALTLFHMANIVLLKRHEVISLP